jgi:transcriptional regulator with XRE-family HTH domain
MLENVLKSRGMSVYRCAGQSGIPYTTLLEVVRGKTRIGNCSADTVRKLARALGMSMEELMDAGSVPERLEFETFKGNACHLLKSSGDIDFVVSVLEEGTVRRYWALGWYPEAFYMLAMVDYLSRIHGLPLCGDYEDIRQMKLDEPIYPKDVRLVEKLSPGMYMDNMLREKPIPEFERFGIIETDLRNVV